LLLAFSIVAGVWAASIIAVPLILPCDQERHATGWVLAVARGLVASDEQIELKINGGEQIAAAIWSSEPARRSELGASAKYIGAYFQPNARYWLVYNLRHNRETRPKIIVVRVFAVARSYFIFFVKIALGEGVGKAGGYAIQGKAALFVEGIEGDYTNVVGLPLTLTSRILEEFGVRWY
jgi:Maf-like protein